jgi:transposase-like protein
MDPQEVWCPKLDCPARGQAGQGNIGVHSQKERRYRCHVCGKTFGARTGTIFHRRRTEEALIVLVITLVSWGCPLVALEHAFGLQPQTIRDWLEAAGVHAEAVHHEQVVQPRDRGQVQADEVRVTTQCGIVWLAMAMLVSTRLWLGGGLSTRRDEALSTRLVQLVARCALLAPLLVVVDGFSSYVEAGRRAFRTRAPAGGRGAPHKVPWPDLGLGQVVKQYAGKRVVRVTRRLRQGAPALAGAPCRKRRAAWCSIPPTLSASTAPSGHAWRPWRGGRIICSIARSCCMRGCIWWGRCTPSVRCMRA